MFRKFVDPDPYGNVRPKARAEIIRATLDGDDPIFHGGCGDCIFRKQATTHEGIRYCSGCLYMNWNRDLPDLGWREYDHRLEVERQRSYQRN